MAESIIFIDAIGLCGPGLNNWETGKSVLNDESSYIPSPTLIPPSEFLPAAERRRVGTTVKLALATATDALATSPYSASDLLSVFSSSGGDGDNCHAICEALAEEDRLISPTKFTNSVHNAPSGYWGIALQAKPASTSICAFDASFGAGFLEAATQSLTTKAPVLFVAYDTPYPEPLHTARPIAHNMGVAFVLNDHRTESSLVKVRFKLGSGFASTMPSSDLESLRKNVPSARCLPLLQAIACSNAISPLVIDLFENQQLLLSLEFGDALDK